MGNRPAGYWILLIIAIAMSLARFMMQSDPQKHAMVQYLAWGAIALLLIAIVFFRGKPDRTPPMPKD